MAKAEVTLEDQQNINSFNKLNGTLHELESEIAIKRVGGSRYSLQVLAEEGLVVIRDVTG
jgi:hypothetical protein